MPEALETAKDAAKVEDADSSEQDVEYDLELMRQALQG